MSKHLKPEKDHFARALREAGYKPLPRWWVTPAQMDIIAFIARQNETDIQKIKDRVYADRPVPQTIEDEIEAAWAARNGQERYSNREY